MPPTTSTGTESFAQLLRTMNRGQFDDLCTSEMEAVVREMFRIAEATGGKPKGKIVISLNLRLENGAMFIEPDLKITAPKQIKGGTVMFPDSHGRLFPQNPRQLDMGFGDAPSSGPVEEPKPPMALAR